MEGIRIGLESCAEIAKKIHSESEARGRQKRGTSQSSSSPQVSIDKQKIERGEETEQRCILKQLSTPQFNLYKQHTHYTHKGCRPPLTRTIFGSLVTVGRSKWRCVLASFKGNLPQKLHVCCQGFLSQYQSSLILALQESIYIFFNPKGGFSPNLKEKSQKLIKSVFIYLRQRVI